MDIDDFNMYMSGSFLKEERGNLAFIHECDGEGEVCYTLYHTPTLKEDCSVPLEEIESTFDMEGFELKPFEVDGKAYSPSYSALRGVKDGVNPRRISLLPLGHSTKRCCENSDIIKMYFSPISTPGEGIREVVEGDSHYSALEDGFFVAKHKAEEEEKEPCTSLRITLTEDGEHRVRSSGGSETVITPSTVWVDLPLSAELEALTGYRKLKALGTYLMEIRGENTIMIPRVFFDEYMRWAKTHLSDTPRVALYRHGMELCVLGEEIPDLFKGLPKLKKYIEELEYEYKTLLRDRGRD